MSTGSILSILAYPQYGYHMVCHTGLSLVHCSYLSVGSLHMSCGRPTDQKLFAGYIRGVRVTDVWGATWITPGNPLQAYFDLRVVVWLTVERLGLTGEAARLPGQPPQSLSRVTP